MANFEKFFVNICEGLSLAYIVFALLCIMLVLDFANSRIFASAILRIFVRWLRFFIYGFAIALLLKAFFGFKDMYLLLAMAFPIYLMLESFCFWKRAVSFSKKKEILFCPYTQTSNAWRPGREFSRLKAEIENCDFSKVESLKSKQNDALCTIFYNAKKECVLIVSFKLNSLYYIDTSFWFVSKDSQNNFIVSTNDSAERIVSFPKNYKFYVRVFRKSFSSLYRFHLNKAKAYNCEWKAEEITNLVYKMYKDATASAAEKNYINRNLNSDEMLSGEGRYKFCKDVAIKNYFGRNF